MTVKVKWGEQLPKTINNALTAVEKKILTYKVEDLAANADITTRAILAIPSDIDATITKASIISNGTPADIDDSNTCVVQLLNGTNSIVSETYDSTTAFPAENALADLGALSATYKVLEAGDKLHLVVTNGTTADPPAFILQVEYTVTKA
jgi:hypothetical protein